MAVKKRGLGRGLDALLGSANTAHKPDNNSDGILRNLPVESLVRGRYQPRKHMDQSALQELAESIRSQGLIQPIVVRMVVAGRFEIIAGERRWRAAQMAGLTEVPAVIRDVSEQAALAIALIENIQRQDLNPLEEAQAIKRLIDEFDLTHQLAADAIGRSRAAVSNLLRLLELDDYVQNLVQEHKLEMGHARALLSLSPTTQREAARQILAQGLSVRETEELSRRLLSGPASAAEKAPPDPNIRSLQESLSERLGAKVLVQHNASGRGRVVIQYNTLDELDGIIAHVK